MSCLSDIDLATLHKSRLEERLNYKLAWSSSTNRHNHHHHAFDGFSDITRECLQRNIRSKCAYYKKNPDVNFNCDTLTEKLNQFNLNTRIEERLTAHQHYSRHHQHHHHTNGHIDDENNCDLFSSTTRRRRSGTWP